ncbi:MAG TPA: hypothetical protein DFS52_26125 [Myxococcales bacterium]|nr:hypothetical protein [Myxococcales bacterium]
MAEFKGGPPEVFVPIKFRRRIRKSRGSEAPAARLYAGDDRVAPELLGQGGTSSGVRESLRSLQAPEV